MKRIDIVVAAMKKFFGFSVFLFHSLNFALSLDLNLLSRISLLLCVDFFRFCKKKTAFMIELLQLCGGGG